MPLAMAVDPSALLLAAGKSFLFALATLLPILNPAASAPIVLGLTEGASPQTRAALARRVARNMILLMAGAMLIGSYVLDVFGISLPIVSVAGGTIIAANAWRLLNAHVPTEDARQALAEGYTPEQARTQAFYPLTFPLSCGPGSISAAITVGVALHDVHLPTSLASVSGGMLALFVIGALMYLAHRYASLLLKPLGETGTTVFLRLMAFILLCLGVQIVWNGVAELVRTL